MLLRPPVPPLPAQGFAARGLAWIALSAVLLLGGTAPARAQSGAPDFLLSAAKPPVLKAKAVHEASGLAVSSRNNSYLWIVNDSGSAPDLHLVEAGGTYRGKVGVSGTANTDWEDLASFTLEGKPFLLAADTGDNTAKRETCTLIVIREPELPAAGKSLDGQTRPAWVIRFRYEDGPRDCESVAVDAAAGTVLMLSKREPLPGVYRLALRPADAGVVQVARRLGTTKVSPTADTLIPFADQPTGLDIAADDSLAAVVTYYGVFLFPRQPAEGWEAAFARRPVPLAPHRLAQAESVAFTKDGNSLYVVSEGRTSRIVCYQRQQAPAKP